MLVKEYRICMPLTVEEYRIGQLYMISKHSLEQSSAGEGVEVTVNKPCEDHKHGRGQYTEKRIYLSSKLPGWAKTFVPKIFYITERAWNYYPFTITEYTCSFLPKLQIRIETQFENNRGDNNQVFVESSSSPPDEVCALDIAFDELPERYYKESEDLRLFHSVKTGRGPLMEGWRSNTQPIMCSYKRVSARFEVYGLQGRVESFIHKNIRDILLIGHRQAVAWIDEWSGMSLEDVREFERDLQEQTNSKLKQNTVMDSAGPRHSLLTRSLSMTDEASLRKLGVQPPHDHETQNTQPHLSKRLNSNPE